MLIGKSEWDDLSAWLAQRVTLLNAIMADFYGPQELLKSGVIPPELLFGNSALLLPCHGIAAPGNIFCTCTPDSCVWG